MGAQGEVAAGAREDEACGEDIALEVEKLGEGVKGVEGVPKLQFNGSTKV